MSDGQWIERGTLDLWEERHREQATRIRELEAQVQAETLGNTVEELVTLDYCQALIAAEREALAGHVSANCFSLPSGGASRSYNAGVRDAIDAIYTCTPADAQAALAARDKRVRDEALREAAGNACSVCCCQDTILALIDADDSGEG